MSQVETNKLLVREFFEAMNRGDVDAIVNAYADDGYVHTMGNTLISGRAGKQQIQDSCSRIFEVFPAGIKFDIQGMTAEGERVAVEATSEGAHVSGQVYRNEYHFLFEFDCGKLKKLKVYMDTERVTDVLCGGQRPEAEV
jgi:uncharacterized protein (TIGR02246 family)